ncbi:hypothetical protein CPB83DRAFT_855095 [Crepidotus variabilis]|uniref:Uncharacterized protein n=1 Tax=Crepidotus variabilis TaxID=179855 RepID=A0A9P6EFF0_9AGAR|nr:hypothetical protein CPB83DRAFT_855095 [Crepidotus variabilis]
MSRPLPRPTRVYNIQVKSHKMTIMHAGLPPTTKVAELKVETLSALRADVSQDALDVTAMEPPEFEVQTVEDFELCRIIKEKGKPTGTFEPLDSSKILRESGISGWETLCLQFRDRNTGDLIPIEYTLPPLYDEEEPVPEGDGKGKRKAAVAFDEPSPSSLTALLKNKSDVSVEIDDATLDF